MKYVVLAFIFCMMLFVPQESFAVVAVSKEKAPSYQEMSKAEKKAFRKDLRKKIKAAKKTPPRGSFGDYWTMGIAFVIAGCVGLIVGGLLKLWLLYSLGGLFLTVGFVLMLLYWLDII